MVLYHSAPQQNCEPSDSVVSFSYAGLTESNLPDTPSASMAVFHPEEKTEKIFLPVVQFPVEEPWLKWLLRIMTVVLIMSLIALWITFA